MKIATAMLTKGTYPSKNENDNNFTKQFIPKSKIRDKVERLEDKVCLLRPNATKGEMMKQFKVAGAIDILYEILGEN